MNEDEITALYVSVDGFGRARIAIPDGDTAESLRDSILDGDEGLEAWLPCTRAGLSVRTAAINAVWLETI